MVTRILLVLALAVPAAVDFPPLGPVVWEANDRNSIPEPKEREISTIYDFMVGTFAQPVGRAADVPRNVRKLAGKPKEAEDVNVLDEVPNSSWFTNRNFVSRMSLEDVQRGPGGTGPDPQGPWTITHCKTNGISPGLRIKDQKGDVYLIKFDPPDFPEMSTSADAVGARFFYAAGYNVPENTVVSFEENILQAEKDLECAGPSGKHIALTAGGLEHFLGSVGRTKDGRLRAIASKFIAGKPKGPFSYTGVRSDDPNDTIPHEHRRELRGLRVIAAFLNHHDVKQINTLDSYVEEDGKKFLKHYLIDFGSTLGSATIAPKSGTQGNENIFDSGEVFKAFITLGIYRRPGDREADPLHPSIGYIEGKELEPSKWRTNYPIAAFENMTDRDAYWGAKIVASFTNEQIAAIVKTGKYSDAIAESVLIEILEQRRDRIIDYYFRRVAPMDRLRLESNSLVFADLAIDAKRDDPARVRYQVTTEAKSVKRVAGTFNHGASIPVDVIDEPTEVKITRTSPGWPELSMSVWVQRVSGVPSIVGIRR